MALPPGVTGKTLTFGRGSFPDGTAVSGRVTITATKNFKHIPSGRPLYKGPMTRTFEDGVATFEELVPNDAPGLDRYDWTFHVAFQLNGVTEQPESYDFAIFVADPATIDGDTLTPVPSSIGIPVSVNALRIPPGGTIGQALVLGSDFGVTWGTFQPTGDYATTTAVGSAVAAEAARAVAAEQTLTTSVGNKVNNSTYTAGLAGKADLATLGATVAADATVRAALVARPTGGTDGQALVKAGADVVWGSVSGGQPYGGRASDISTRNTVDVAALTALDGGSASSRDGISITGGTAASTDSARAFTDGSATS